ncbi:NAC domain-containing protein 30 [Gossypium hirsutum]|nr:NAC domain-containing protein 30-like [Gossypium hirsutum]
MDKNIPEGGLKPIGSKKTLEFHTGRHPSGHKTEWKMHEYKVDPSLIKPQNKPEDGMTLDTCVLCKVYKTQRKGQNENNLESFDQNTNTSSSSQNFDVGASSEATIVSYPMTGFAGQPDNGLSPLTTSPMPNYEYYSNTWFQPTVDGALNNEAFVPAANRNDTVIRNRNSDTTWPYHPYYSNGLLLHRGVNNGASTSTVARNYIDNNVRAVQVRPPNATLTQVTVNNGGPNGEAHSMAASRSNTMSRGRGEAQRGSRRGGNRGKIIMLPRG